MNKKRKLMFIGVIFIVLSLTVGMYFLLIDRKSIENKTVNFIDTKLKTILATNVGSLTEFATFEETTYFSGHSIVFSPDGKLLAFQNERGVLRLRNVNAVNDSFDLVDSQLKGNSDISDIKFSSDGLHLAVVYTAGLASFSGYESKNNIIFWNVQTKTQEERFPLSSIEITSLAFSPDGQLLATASTDHTVKLWNVKAKSLVSTLSEHTDEVTSLAFSPDGQLLASASADHTIKLWNVKDKSLVSTLSGRSDAVTSLTFSPDGQLLASASADHTVKLWNIKDKSLVSTLAGHTDVVTSITFSPDGELLVSGSKDNTIALWNTSTQQLVKRIERKSFITSGAFNPSGTILATQEFYSPVTLWGVQ